MKSWKLEMRVMRVCSALSHGIYTETGGKEEIELDEANDRICTSIIDLLSPIIAFELYEIGTYCPTA
jgi:hypothetical protein